MTIEQPPFVRQSLDEEERQDVFTVKLNAEERKLLEQIKDALHEPKDSTAIKQAAFEAGAKVLFDPVTHALCDLCVGNYKRARRVGKERDVDV
ncbi:MAG: hypothetical protein V1735_06315 [Nanoarchaeota archaeon]